MITWKVLPPTGGEESIIDDDNDMMFVCVSHLYYIVYFVYGIFMDLTAFHIIILQNTLILFLIIYV